MTEGRTVKVRRIAPDPRLKRYRWISEGESWQMGQDWTEAETREIPEEIYARSMRRIARFCRDSANE
jgi:hypothetical protein